MTKRQLKKSSKRKSLSMKYKINRKVREHHRKVRKEARKASKLGLPVKSNKKTTRIPNSFPHKKELMEEQEILIKQEKDNNKKGKNKEEDPIIIEDESNSQVITESPEIIKKCNFKFELNILIEICDVIIEVIDARDPLSYRSRELENNVKTKGKKLIILLNKIDLVTKENSINWAKLIRRDIPTILYSTKNECEETKKELINLINDLCNKKNKKIYVGLVGYPNTGKNSVVETFKKIINVNKSKVIPGSNEVMLDKFITVFDKVGVIFSKNDVGPLMPKSCKDVDEVKNPLEVVKQLLNTLDKNDLIELYEIPDYDNITEFLENIAKKYNFYMKKKILDLERACRQIIKDIVEGKIKFQSDSSS